MNKYELVSIVRPTADEPIVESVHKSVSEVISNGGGSVSEQGVWQRRKPVSYTHLTLPTT